MYEKPISEYTPEEIRAYQQSILDESYAELFGRGNICAGIKYETTGRMDEPQYKDVIRYRNERNNKKNK